MRSVRIAPLFLALAGFFAAAATSRAGDVSALDKTLQALWSQEQVTPTPRCDDATFLRRAWLDLAGRVPPAEDVRKLAGEKTPLDRGALVDRLLATRDFERFWGMRLTEYLTDRRPFEQEGYDPRTLNRFLDQALHDNVPYDELVRTLLLAEGSSDTDGPVNFLLRYNVDPVALAGATSRKFLGLTLHCAECHNHPHADWKQRDFHGLAAYFARLRRLSPTDAQEGENFQVVVERQRGEYRTVDKAAPVDSEGNPNRKIIYPRLPGEEFSDASPQRRDALVRWMTSEANPYFGRHLCNEVWNWLLGERLVLNLDHWSASDSSAPARVLNALEESFRADHRDLKGLLRTVVLSEAYQRTPEISVASASSESAGLKPSEAPTKKLWQGTAIRPLSVDQLQFSVVQGLGYRFDADDARLAQAVGDDFTFDLPLQSFGDSKASLRRSISLFSGEQLRAASQFTAQRLIRIHGATPGMQHLDDLFVSLLGRRPTPEELEDFLDLAGTGSDQGEAERALEDVTWVLLNSAEFGSNH